MQSVAASNADSSTCATNDITTYAAIRVGKLAGVVPWSAQPSSQQADPCSARTPTVEVPQDVVSQHTRQVVDHSCGKAAGFGRHPGRRAGQPSAAQRTARGALAAMAHCCAALYFLNLRGDVLIERRYRDDVECASDTTHALFTTLPLRSCHALPAAKTAPPAPLAHHLQSSTPPHMLP